MCLHTYVVLCVVKQRQGVVANEKIGQMPGHRIFLQRTIVIPRGTHVCMSQAYSKGRDLKSLRLPFHKHRLASLSLHYLLFI